MTVRLEEGLIYEILSLVEEIPAGCVASYGQIARLIGRERSARLVGRVLSMAETYGDYPCHRVVGTGGSLTGYAGGMDKKVKLLELERADMRGLFVPKKGTAL